MSLLKLQNVSIQISQKSVCQCLNLAIQPGEIWGILGQNGSGKTTFLHTLAALLPITHGKIFLKNMSCITLSPNKIAKILGILFQQHHDIFPQSVLETCLSARFIHLKKFCRETVHDRVIAKAALDAMQLGALLDRNIQTLSGGERQRLAIAMLLTQSPELYLLDEPTNHLDIHHQHLVLSHFREIVKTKSISVMMSLHDMNIAQRYCDKVLLLLNNGQTIQGDTQDIFTADNLTKLYQHPIYPIQTDTQCIWTTSDKEFFS